MSSGAQAGDNESPVGINATTEHDEEGTPMTPGLTSGGINLESSGRDLTHQAINTTDGTINRTRATEQTTTGEHQPARVQFTPSNNYFRNVSENKDVVKLVALLATCINATKKVSDFLLLLICIDKDVFFYCVGYNSSFRNLCTI